MTRAERDLLVLVAGAVLRHTDGAEYFALRKAFDAVVGDAPMLVSDERLSEIIVEHQGPDEVISMAQELTVHRARARAAQRGDNTRG